MTCMKENLCSVGYRYNVVKGLRMVLEEFVVTMHEGACETGSPILRPFDGLLFQVLTGVSTLPGVHVTLATIQLGVFSSSVHCSLSCFHQNACQVSVQCQYGWEHPRLLVPEYMALVVLEYTAEHIEASTKWLIFCRWHFQMNFLE